MKQNKKGFTLIELLAVIVILAIIALIATPIILNMINDAKDSAAKDSALAYQKAAETYVTMHEMSSNGIATAYATAPVTTTEGCDIADPSENAEEGQASSCSQWITALNATVKGTKPTSGTIKVTGNNVSFTDIEFNGRTFSDADLQS